MELLTPCSFPGPCGSPFLLCRDVLLRALFSIWKQSVDMNEDADTRGQIAGRAGAGTKILQSKGRSLEARSSQSPK